MESKSAVGSDADPLVTLAPLSRWRSTWLTSAADVVLAGAPPDTMVCLALAELVLLEVCLSDTSGSMPCRITDAPRNLLSRDLAAWSSALSPLSTTMSALRMRVRTSCTSVTAVRSLRKDLVSEEEGVEGRGDATGEPTLTSIEADCFRVGFVPKSDNGVEGVFGELGVTGAVPSPLLERKLAERKINPALG